MPFDYTLAAALSCGTIGDPIVSFGREVVMQVMKLFGIVLVFAVIPLAGTARGQAIEEQTMEAATRVLREIMAVPLKGIPASLLADAQGVAVVPGMIKGGFIVGIEHGKGVVIIRDKTGAWQSPNFITITGGGIGWQAGVQSTDVVLVFRTRGSVEGLMRGKFTVGADASVAAGPVGRQLTAGTDIKLQSEIYSYSRSRGLFLGVSLDGASLQIDQRANSAFYSPRPGQPQGQYPQSALNFITQLAAYSNPHAATPTAGTPVAANDREAVGRQLIESSRRLNGVLDASWQQYLALPAAFTDGATPPSPEVVIPTRDRFQAIAGNPQYRSLSERHEFQETLALIQRYIAISSSGTSSVLSLPPPPK